MSYKYAHMFVCVFLHTPNMSVFIQRMCVYVGLHECVCMLAYMSVCVCVCWPTWMCVLRVCVCVCSSCFTTFVCLYQPITGAPSGPSAPSFHHMISQSLNLSPSWFNSQHWIKKTSVFLTLCCLSLIV